LFSAFAANGHPLRVVCDWDKVLTDCVSAPNIKVLRNCYDDAFSQELKAAGMVVVPLWASDISAGQMVALQAMAFRKPIVVTRTPTIEEYLHHEKEALLVPPGDAAALSAAVDRLRQDPEFARCLADTAYHAYVDRHSMRDFVRYIVGALATPPAKQAQ
jgi:glycosyltransferase involved in cell wall biosynthesis